MWLSAPVRATHFHHRPPRFSRVRRRTVPALDDPHKSLSSPLAPVCTLALYGVWTFKFEWPCSGHRFGKYGLNRSVLYLCLHMCLFVYLYTQKHTRIHSGRQMVVQFIGQTKIQLTRHFSTRESASTNDITTVTLPHPPAYCHLIYKPYKALLFVVTCTQYVDRYMDGWIDGWINS